MRPLRYSINVTLDGCCDHEEAIADPELHEYYAASLGRADALLMGRVIYQMMEEAWRRPADGVWPEWMDAAAVAFAEVIDGAEKLVVSSTLPTVDWNATLVEGDLEAAVRALKDQPGDGLYVGGLTLPRALAQMGLIDEYELVVQPIVAGHGPRLFDGLPERLDLELVDRHELASGVVSLRYVPRAPRT